MGASISSSTIVAKGRPRDRGVWPAQRRSAVSWSRMKRSASAVWLAAVIAATAALGTTAYGDEQVGKTTQVSIEGDLDVAIELPPLLGTDSAALLRVPLAGARPGVRAAGQSSGRGAPWSSTRCRSGRHALGPRGARSPRAAPAPRDLGPRREDPSIARRLEVGVRVAASLDGRSSSTAFIGRSVRSQGKGGQKRPIGRFCVPLRYPSHGGRGQWASDSAPRPEKRPSGLFFGSSRPLGSSLLSFPAPRPSLRRPASPSLRIASSARSVDGATRRSRRARPGGGVPAPCAASRRRSVRAPPSASPCGASRALCGATLFCKRWQ